MSLVDIWKSNPEQLKEKQISQIIAFAGDGKLRDGSKTAEEFRSFLAHVSSELLADFSNQCLTGSFKDSGLVLQDLINQVGSRLGFKVTPGRYRGTSKDEDIGFDGLWIGPDGDAIVIEVKTTDAYRISLDTTANYRKELIRKGDVTAERSSILYVVGRNDTGDLEAQVRGSRHAWNIRLISIDALLKLMFLKEELEDPAIMSKIRDIIVPQEFTKVDGIIDLVFSTADEVKQESLTNEGEKKELTQKASKEKKFTPVQFRSACIDRISKVTGNTLVKRSAAIFSTPDEKYGLSCAISREYTGPDHEGYWFAFHPTQKATLEKFDSAHVCFGCGSEKRILMVPREVFFSWLDSFNVTEVESRRYWHVQLSHSHGKWSFYAKGGKENFNGTQYYLEG